MAQESQAENRRFFTIRRLHPLPASYELRQFKLPMASLPILAVLGLALAALNDPTTASRAMETFSLSSPTETPTSASLVSNPLGSPEPATPTALIVPTLNRTALALEAKPTSTLTKGAQINATSTAAAKERIAGSRPTSTGLTPIPKPAGADVR